jgi:transposase-like protein
MSPRHKYKKSYTETVIDMALSRNRISNVMVAKRLEIDEKTIRNWRKEHPEFDKAFTEAHHQVMEKINNTARKSLDVRKKRTVVKETDDGKIITDDVLPNHNDLAAFAKLGLKQTFSDPEAEKLKAYGRDILKRYSAGEITPEDAATMLEFEGLPVPETLMLRVRQLIGPDAKGAGGSRYRNMTDEELESNLRHLRKQTDEPEGW